MPGAPRAAFSIAGLDPEGEEGEHSLNKPPETRRYPMHAPKMPPPKSEIAEMEPFEGLEMERIVLVRTAGEAEAALAELCAAGRVGFDTEAKPTFHKGQKSDGPHVFQFATVERAYIFQSHVTASHGVIVEALKTAELTKIGFGLGGDLQQISQRFGIRPASIVDLDRTFRQLGYKNAVGAKSAVAMLFGRKLAKSKSVTTSNWAARELTERQLLYAANDAYAALRVFHALQEAGKAAPPGE